MSSASDADTIHKASARGDLEAVRRFVEVQGVEVDVRDGHGDTPLILSALNSQQNDQSSIPTVIRYLVSKHADVEAVLQQPHHLRGCTSLVLVSRFGCLKSVQVLLEQGGADVNRTHMGDGHTALAHAARSLNGLSVVYCLALISGDGMRVSRYSRYCAAAVGVRGERDWSFWH